MVSINKKFSDKQDSLVLEAQGRLDRNTVKKALENFSKTLSSEDSFGKVLLDLGKVEAMDTAGVALLVYLSNSLKAKGVSFKIVNIGSQVRGLLKLARLEKFFQLQEISNEGRG